MAEPKTNDTPVEKKKRISKKKANAPERKLETMLWAAADKLRGHMDAAEYKHVVLGLIFLKYISDAFNEHRQTLDQQISDPSSELYIEKPMDRYATLEDRDEYTAANIFWVPQEARWAFLQGKAKQPTIGKLIDDPMVVIERYNPSLEGVLPKDYPRPALDKQQPGELIDLITNMGDEANRSQDVFGRVYELPRPVATAEDEKGGQFYAARCVMQLLVEKLAPYKGRIFDPSRGSSSIFVQSEEFVEATVGESATISVLDQVSRSQEDGRWPAVRGI